MNSSLTPEHITSLKAYSSAKSEKLTGSTWLNANESPFIERFELTFESLNRYPDPQPESVISSYANYAGVTNDSLLMTRGADEGIELLVSTFCESGKDAIVQFLPTYGMYTVTAQSSNVALINLSQDDLINSPADNLVERANGAKLIFVCNPNNPTGNTVSVERVEEIVRAFKDKAIVVVDEAYIEFCEELSSVPLIAKYNNVVVLRTLSKAFALAGLRTGFVISNPELIKTMRKVLAPYPVSSVFAQIAEQALTPSNIKSMKRQVAIIKSNRVTLSEHLSNCNKVVQVLASNANFLTIQLTNKRFINNAMEQGLIMRPFTLFGEDNWLRISIGSEQELNTVFSWLAKING
jgi:histidinol-phosphate aminotransferase